MYPSTSDNTHCSCMKEDVPTLCSCWQPPVNTPVGAQAAGLPGSKKPGSRRLPLQRSSHSSERQTLGLEPGRRLQGRGRGEIPSPSHRRGSWSPRKCSCHSAGCLATRSCWGALDTSRKPRNFQGASQSNQYPCRAPSDVTARQLSLLVGVKSTPWSPLPPECEIP